MVAMAMAGHSRTPHSNEMQFSSRNHDVHSSELPEILSLADLGINVPQDVHNHLAEQYAAIDAGAGLSSDHASPHLDKILQSMKTSPVDTCCRVNLIKASVEDVMRGLRDHFRISKNEPHGHDYMVRRHETMIDLILVRREPEQNELGSIGMLYRCCVPPNPEHDNIFPHWPSRADKGWPMSHRSIIVDRFCGEAVLRGANVFVRGILSADSGIEADDEISVYADLPDPSAKSVPRGLALERYSGRCVFIGIGISCCTRSNYFAQSTGIGVRMIQIAGPPQPPMNSILTGKMMMQNLPSACVAHALNPKPGDVVLDMCCAPGGKTTHLASLMGNEGMVIACDKSRKKMIACRDFIQSMGATCVIPLALDSTKALLGLDKGECWRSPRDIVSSAFSTNKKGGLLDIKGFYANSFDKVLLDPPCSALGLRPKLVVDTKSSQGLSKIAAYQQKFVRNAVRLLKPGGEMTYSTCTINACENEDMVKHILAEYPMRLVSISSELPGLPGLAGRGLTEKERHMIRRFDPCGEDDTMGFFLAKFEKMSN